MGWTFIQRNKGITNLEVFTAEFWVGRIVGIATPSPHETYVAYKRDDGLVMGVVLLTRYNPRSTFNFGWKDMDEGMGPYAYNCPRRILALLSPVELLYPDSPWAQENATTWRTICRERRTR